MFAWPVGCSSAYSSGSGSSLLQTTPSRCSRVCSSGWCWHSRSTASCRNCARASGSHAAWLLASSASACSLCRCSCSWCSARPRSRRPASSAGRSRRRSRSSTTFRSSGTRCARTMPRARSSNGSGTCRPTSATRRLQTPRTDCSVVCSQRWSWCSPRLPCFSTASGSSTAAEDSSPSAPATTQTALPECSTAPSAATSAVRSRLLPSWACSC